MSSNGKFVSPYYPPRARWYAPLLSPWRALGRLLHLDHIRLPTGVRPLLFLLSLLLPGFSFYALGRRRFGAVTLAVYGLAGVMFLARLGYPAAGAAYGLIISAHATSLFYLEAHWLREPGLGWKVLLALATLLGTWQLVYAPLLGFAGRHWFIPLRVRGQVVIVKPGGAVRAVKRGDWIVYGQPPGRLVAVREEGVFVQAGDDCAQVLAVAGDRLGFSTNVFTVNGMAHPLRLHMPTAGRWTVPEKHWFVWPNFAIRGQGQVGEAALAATLVELGTVSQTQLVGKPYPRWFGRRQRLEPGS